MPKYVITITENGTLVGYVGRVAVHFDPESDRLRPDFPVADDLKDAMTYVTRELAEQFVDSFKSAAEGEVDFHVMDLSIAKPAANRQPTSLEAPVEDATGKRRSSLSKVLGWFVGCFRR